MKTSRLLAVAGIIALVALSLAGDSAPLPRTDIGRFMIFSQPPGTELRTFKLDSVTGDSWVYFERPDTFPRWVRLKDYELRDAPAGFTNSFMPHKTMDEMLDEMRRNHFK